MIHAKSNVAPLKTMVTGPATHQRATKKAGADSEAGASRNAVKSKNNKEPVPMKTMATRRAVQACSDEDDGD